MKKSKYKLTTKSKKQFTVVKRHGCWGVDDLKRPDVWLPCLGIRLAKHRAEFLTKDLATFGYTPWIDKKDYQHHLIKYIIETEKEMRKKKLPL